MQPDSDMPLPPPARPAAGKAQNAAPALVDKDEDDGGFQAPDQETIRSAGVGNDLKLGLWSHLVSSRACPLDAPSLERRRMKHLRRVEEDRGLEAQAEGTMHNLHASACLVL